MSIGQAQCKHLNNLLNARLKCKNNVHRHKLDEKIINTKHHISNLLNPKQANLLLSLISKYDLQPLSKVKIKPNHPTKEYEYKLYSINFDIETIADDVIVPRIPQNKKFNIDLVMASHSSNIELGSTINANSKSLHPNVLYTYKNNVLNQTTLADVKQQLINIQKVLKKYIKKH